MTKSELRKIYLEKQRALTVAERDENSRLIANRFFSILDLSKIKTAHCFIPILKNNEIDTGYVYRKLWRDFPGIKVAVPRIKNLENEIESVVFAEDTNLILNNWEIPEPENGELIQPKDIDVVVVPLLAFDEDGYRVGYGKGYYDKFLAKCRVDCLKIGLSYFEPVECIGDRNEFDIRLDCCVTPLKIYEA